MRILVLGGSGFIGSHVVDGLVSAGHQVRVVDRMPLADRPSVEFMQMDFNDVMSLSESLMGIDVVIHLVSTSVPSTSNKDPISDVQGNLVNTIKLLDVMRQSGVRKILYFSSGGTVYGHPKITPISESHPTDPICSYGIVKLAIEKYLQMYAELYGFISIILRPSNPYGYGQRRRGVQGFIGTCINAALTDTQLTLWGDGSVVRDYIHVSDVALATVAALVHEQSAVFNISSGKGYSLNDIIVFVEKYLQKKMDIVYQSGRDFDVPTVILNNQKAIEQLRWQPRIDIEEGISETLSVLSGKL